MKTVIGQFIKQRGTFFRNLQQAAINSQRLTAERSDRHLLAL